MNWIGRLVCDFLLKELRCTLRIIAASPSCRSATDNCLVFCPRVSFKRLSFILNFKKRATTLQPLYNLNNIPAGLKPLWILCIRPWYQVFFPLSTWWLQVLYGGQNLHCTFNDTKAAVTIRVVKGFIGENQDFFFHHKRTIMMDISCRILSPIVS